LHYIFKEATTGSIQTQFDQFKFKRESRMTLSHVIWCDSVSTSEPEKLH